MIIEVCIESTKGLLAAKEHNLDRVEVCSELLKDGLTPSIPLQEKAKEILQKDRFIMIRPHNKGFIYNSNDIVTMKKSITKASYLNPKGVVFGALTEDNKIDIKCNKELLNHAKKFNLKCTFHRAFDQCINPIKSFEEIKLMGFNWILTSGQEKTAELGIPLLKKLSELKKDKIKILAGGGINVNNCRAFQKIGIDGIHFSIDKGDKVEKNKIKGILNQLSID